MAENLDPGARAAAEQKARKAARDAARLEEPAEDRKGKEVVPPWEKDAMGISLVDTHAHIDGEDFDVDREEMLSRAKKAGVVAVVTFGDTMESSARVVKLAASHENVFAGVGVHPENAFPFTQAEEDNLVVHQPAEYRHGGTVERPLFKDIRLNDTVVKVILCVTVNLVRADALRHSEFFKICNHNVLFIKDLKVFLRYYLHHQGL